MQLSTMVESVKARILPTLILFSALSVSASAAFYSVSGLSKLFAGAALEVMIMAGSLEVAKLVTATLLHRYWKQLSFILKSYLTLAVVVLVLITSMGIYGFLSAAYQETFAQLTTQNNKISFIQEKADFYEKDVTRFDKELERISENINILSNAKATAIQIRDTTVAGGFRSSVSTAELRLSQRRIEVEEANRKDLRAKRDVAADSLQKYKLNILELKSDTNVAGELGPLQYLAGLLDMEMDVIINYLLLTIVFVFDPLAISLVLAANFAFAQISPRRREEVIGDIVVVDEEVLEPRLKKESLSIDEYTKKYKDSPFLPEEEDDLNERMDIIGRNGNDGEHYDKMYELYGESGSKSTESADDWEIAKEDLPVKKVNPIKEELTQLEKYLKEERIGGINPRLEKDTINKINKLKEQLKDDSSEDLTITY